MMNLMKPTLAALSIALLAGCSSTPDTTAMMSDNDFDLTDSSRFVELEAMYEVKHPIIAEVKTIDKQGNPTTKWVTESMEGDSMRIYQDLTAIGNPVCIKQMRKLELFNVDPKRPSYPVYTVSQNFITCPQQLNMDKPS